MLAAEGHVQPAWAISLRMARPVDVERGYIMSAACARCGPFPPRTAGLERTNERATDYRAYFRIENTGPHGIDGTLLRPHSGCQYAHHWTYLGPATAPWPARVQLASGPRHPGHAQGRNPQTNTHYHEPSRIPASDVQFTGPLGEIYGSLAQLIICSRLWTNQHPQP